MYSTFNFTAVHVSSCVPSGSVTVDFDTVFTFQQFALTIELGIYE